MKILKWVTGVIFKGLFVLVPAIAFGYMLVWVAKNFKDLANLVAGKMLFIFLHKDYPWLNMIAFLAMLFLLGLFTKAKFFAKLEKIFLYIPVLGHLIKHFNKWVSFWEISKKHGVIYVKKYGIGSWQWAVAVNKFNCEAGEKYNVNIPMGHLGADMATFDRDTVILGTINWEDALKLWLSFQIIVPEKISNLKEMTINEYWDSIYPEKNN